VSSQFERAARDYCTFIDGCKAEARETFVVSLERQLIGVYRAALDLEPREPPEDDAPRISQEEWRAVYDLVAEKLADANDYWLVFDPFAHEGFLPVLGSLADDVADIYRDLRSGLALIDEDGLSAEDASWDWRFGFDHHWGRHAANALYALRVLIDGGGSVGVSSDPVR
jgi:uncharacterized protein DUF5063